jgi:hypothetical protein
MSVQVHWDNTDKTVIRYDFEGKWTWDEFYAAFEQARSMIAGIPHVVDFICVIQQVSGFFMPLNLLFHIRKIYTDVPSNVGITILAGPPSELIAIYSMIKRAYPMIAVRYAVAPTLEQARIVLRQRQTIR